MAEKKNILTYEGLKKLEDELQDLKVNQRREIAQKIENEMDYPGQIKVHLIRESRAIEYAK